MTRAAWVQVARMTLHEAVRRKLVLAGGILSVAYLGLFATGVILAERNGGVVDAFAASAMTSLGLYALRFLGAFLALVVAVGAISSEIESGALLALLARPLSRRAYLLGRWIALTGLVTSYVVVMAAALMLIARVTIGFEPTSGAGTVALMAFESVLLLSLALYGSTRMSTVANGVVVFGLFALSWVAGFIELIGSLIDNAAMTNVGIAVSLLLPADALWRGASYYSQSPLLLAQQLGADDVIPFFGSAPPAPALLAWSAAYVAACLVLAVRRFTRRDL